MALPSQSAVLFFVFPIIFFFRRESLDILRYIFIAGRRSENVSGKRAEQAVARIQTDLAAAKTAAEKVEAELAAAEQAVLAGGDS